MNGSDRKATGQYTLHRLSIVSHRGVEADLLHIFSEVNLFEDILRPTISGNLHLVDALNLVSNLPIVGGETVHIKWSTAGKEDSPIDQTMVVHKIGEKVPVSDKVRSYTLFLASPEEFINQQTQLIREYTGTASNIAERIYKESFKDNGKVFEVEETKNIHSLVPCHWKPFRVFKYLSKLAISKTNRTGFLFYETLAGFHFRSLESLFGQPPSIEYKSLPSVATKNFSSDEINDRLTNVESHVVGETGMVLDMLNMGALGHQWSYIDVFNKNVVSTDYQYHRDFDKAKHVEEYPVFPEEPSWISKPVSARFSRVVHPHSSAGNRTEAEWLMMNRRYAQMVQLSSVEQTIEVTGDSDMRAGLVVEFDIPAPESMDTKFKRERFFSGKSLVSAIRHRLTRDQYMMYMTLSKDSLSDDPSKGVTK